MNNDNINKKKSIKNLRLALDDVLMQIAQSFSVSFNFALHRTMAVESLLLYLIREFNLIHFFDRNIKMVKYDLGNCLCHYLRSHSHKFTFETNSQRQPNEEG